MCGPSWPGGPVGGSPCPQGASVHQPAAPRCPHGKRGPGLGSSLVRVLVCSRGQRAKQGRVVPEGSQGSCQLRLRAGASPRRGLGRGEAFQGWGRGEAAGLRGSSLMALERWEGSPWCLTARSTAPRGLEGSPARPSPAGLATRSSLPGSRARQAHGGGGGERACVVPPRGGRRRGGRRRGGRRALRQRPADDGRQR